MKSAKKFIISFFAAVVMFAAGCSKRYSLIGVWKYTDENTGVTASYDLRENGTGYYSYESEDNSFTYELVYRVRENHLLVSFVNTDKYAEDDVFDSECSFRDENTMVIKNPAGGDLVFIKQ